MVLDLVPAADISDACNVYFFTNECGEIFSCSFMLWNCQVLQSLV